MHSIRAKGIPKKNGTKGHSFSWMKEFLRMKTGRRKGSETIKIEGEGVGGDQSRGKVNR